MKNNCYRIIWIILIIPFLLLSSCATKVQQQEPVVSEQQSISLSTIAEQLRLKVTWNPQESKAILQGENYNVVVCPQSKVAWIQSQEKVLDFPAYVSNREIFVPYSFYNEIKRLYPTSPDYNIRYSEAYSIPYSYSDSEANADVHTVTPLQEKKQPVIPKTKLSTTSLKPIVILDAGHGGKDPGAVSDTLQEKNFTLSLALKVESILKKYGVQVIMTRTKDEYLSLQQRVAIANKYENAPCFVSIHLNSSKNAQANGYEFWIPQNRYVGRYDYSRRLARYIQANFKQNIPFANRGIKENEYYVLKHTVMPAVLVECCFISSNHDMQWMNKEDSLNTFALAVARGILSFIH
jgi:N-acetylmuramoyl-L-alanine amidase